VEKKNFVSSEACSEDEVASDNSKLRSRDESRDTLRTEDVKNVTSDERKRVPRRSTRTRDESRDRENRKELDRLEAAALDGCNGIAFLQDSFVNVVTRETDVLIRESDKVTTGEPIGMNGTKPAVTGSHKHEGTCNSKNQSINIKIKYDTDDTNAKTISGQQGDHNVTSKDYISREHGATKRGTTESSKRQEVVVTRNSIASASSLDIQLSKPNGPIEDVRRRGDMYSLPTGSVIDGRFSLTNTVTVPLQSHRNTSPRTRRSTITIGSASAPASSNLTAILPPIRTSAAISMPVVTKTNTAQPSKVQVATVTTPSVRTTTLHPVTQAKQVQKATVTTPAVKITTLQLVPQAPLQHTVRPAVAGPSSVQRAITLALVKPVAIGLAAVKPTSTEPGVAKRSGQWLKAVKQVAVASATAVSQVAKPIAAGLVPGRLAALKLSTSKGPTVTQSTMKPSVGPMTSMSAMVVKAMAVYQQAGSKSTAIKPAVVRAVAATTATPVKDISRADKRNTNFAPLASKVNGDVNKENSTSPGYVEVPIKLTHTFHDPKYQPVRYAGKLGTDSTASKDAPVLKKTSLLRGLSAPSDTTATKKVPVVIKVPGVKVTSLNYQKLSRDESENAEDHRKHMTPLSLEPVYPEQRSETVRMLPEEKKISGTEIHLVPARNTFVQPKPSGTSRAAVLMKPPTPPSDLPRELITPLEIPKEVGSTEGHERFSPGWYSSYSPSHAPLGTSSLGRQSTNMTSKRLTPLQVSNTSSLGRAHVSNHLEEPLTEPKRCSSASDRYIDPIVNEAKWGAYNSTGRPNSWATVFSSYDRPGFSEFTKTDSNASRRIGLEMDTTPGYRPMAESGRHLASELGISNTARNRWFTGLEEKNLAPINVPPYRSLFSGNSVRDDRSYLGNHSPRSTTSITSESPPYHELSPIRNIPLNRSDSFQQGGSFSTRNSFINDVVSNERFGKNSFQMRSKGNAGISEIDVKPMSNIQFHSMLRTPRTTAAFSSDQSDDSQYSGFLVLLGTRRGVTGSVADLTMSSESTMKSPWRSSASQWNKSPMNFSPMTTSFESAREPSAVRYDDTSTISTPRTLRAYTRSRTDSEIIRQRRV